MKRFIQALNDPDLIAKAISEQSAKLRDKGFPSEWSQTGVVFEDQYLRIRRDAVEFPSGALGTYIKVERSAANPGGVIIVPRLGKKVVLLRHWRYALNSESLEFPRGFMNPNETPEEASKRELLEETGGAPLSLRLLGMVQPDTGLMDMASSVFGAEILSVNNPEIEEGALAMVALSKPELIARIGSGEITDGLTLSAFTIAAAQGWL